MKDVKQRYKLDNFKFLEEYAEREGVVKMDCGVLYRIEEQGDGLIPKQNSLVQVYYKGTFINGKQFDSNMEDRVPMALRVRDVIEGWQRVLQIMPVGSTYEAVIPFDMGYGIKAVDGIRGFSTLVFKIKLVSIDK